MDTWAKRQANADIDKAWFVESPGAIDLEGKTEKSADVLASDTYVVETYGLRDIVRAVAAPLPGDSRLSDLGVHLPWQSC